MKVLVIRKTDKTIHKVPLANKGKLMAFNNKLPREKQWTFEEMEESEAEKLPFIDEAYVTGAEAASKVQELSSVNATQAQRIAELEAMLAGKNGGGSKDDMLSTSGTAGDAITMIGSLASVPEVLAFIAGDERKTVKEAAEKRIAELEAA